MNLRHPSGLSHTGALILFGCIVFVGLGIAVYLVKSFSEQTLEPISNISQSEIINTNVVPVVNTNNTASARLATYEIVDTNQTGCYDNTSSIDCPETGKPFFGQDAQYVGREPSYTQNGDGTVTDTVTGLMWQQNPGEKLTYAEAVKKAESFTLAGFSDWRIPTIKELYSLIDFKGTDPSSPDTATAAGLIPFIDDDAFAFLYGDTATGSRVIDSQWITSTINVSTVFNGQECFFGVNFADGRIKCYPTVAPQNNGYYLIMVRGSNSYGENAFAQAGNVVTDTATGLMWQQADSTRGMLWKEALAYCEDLFVDGYTDWRLPNAKELQSIVDYSRSPDTTDSPAVNPVFGSSEITNEAGQQDFPYYWTSTTHKNLSNVYDSAVYISFGRALGNMPEFGGWIDVHGAGAQRSDPKAGVPANQVQGFGPQGDARRAENYVRCVRGGGVSLRNDTDPASTEVPEQQTPAVEPTTQTPPQEAINACIGKNLNDACSFSAPGNQISGTCKSPSGGLACVP